MPTVTGKAAPGHAASVVVVAAAVTQPVAVAIETHARHEQEIGRDRLLRLRLGNAVMAFAHRRVRRPGVEGKRRVALGNDGEGGAAGCIGGEPGGDPGACIELAAQGPIEPDRARRELRDERIETNRQRLADCHVGSRLNSPRKQLCTPVLFGFRMGVACYAWAHLALQ